MRTPLVVLVTALTIAGCGSSKKPDHTGATIPNGQTIKGTGYSYQLPASWKDGSAALKGSAIKFDSAFIKPGSKVPHENIIVIRETPPGLKSSDLPDVNTTFRGQAGSLADSKGVEPTRPVKLDGEAADTYRYILKQGGSIGRQRQEFAIHGGAVYTITWTAPVGTFATSEQLFNQVLATWHWTS